MYQSMKRISVLRLKHNKNEPDRNNGANPYQHRSETIGSLNEKNLNSEIETPDYRFVQRPFRSALNEKNLNSEIETRSA